MQITTVGIFWILGHLLDLLDPEGISLLLVAFARAFSIRVLTSFPEVWNTSLSLSSVSSCGHGARSFALILWIERVAKQFLVIPFDGLILIIALVCNVGTIFACRGLLPHGLFRWASLMVRSRGAG